MYAKTDFFSHERGIGPNVVHHPRRHSWPARRVQTANRVIFPASVSQAVTVGRFLLPKHKGTNPVTPGPCSRERTHVGMAADYAPHERTANGKGRYEHLPYQPFGFNGDGATQIATRLKISRQSVYNALREPGEHP